MNLSTKAQWRVPIGDVVRIAVAERVHALASAEHAHLGRPHVLVSREQAARALALDFHADLPPPVYGRVSPT